MKILITGATGLIGSRLIRHLLESGSMNIRAGSRYVRTWSKGVEGCVVDIDQPATLCDACKGVDAVINLSSMAERFCSTDPYAALRVNGGGTLALVLAALSAGVSRFIQVSTSKVYGNNPSGVITEDVPSKPQSHYAITHRVAEDYVVSQHANSVIFRLANGFGAPVGDLTGCWNIIVNDFCRQAVVDRKIIIKSSGQAWRNFVPMHDVERALSLAATDLPPGTYNLGSTESMQLYDLAKRISLVCSDTFGFLPEINVGPILEGEQYDPLDYRIDKLVTSGFETTSSFTEELVGTLLAAQRIFVSDI